MTSRRRRSSRRSVDGWVLTRLDRAVEEVSGLIDAYDFAAAVKALYRFVWNDVCDWYLEAAKARLYSDDPAERAQVSATLRFVLDRTLRLCHPVLPHVTEELWRFAGGEGLLLRARVPRGRRGRARCRGRGAVEAAIEAVRSLRRLRDDAGLGPRAPLADRSSRAARTPSGCAARPTCSAASAASR